MRFRRPRYTGAAALIGAPGQDGKVSRKLVLLAGLTCVILMGAAAAKYLDDRRAPEKTYDLVVYHATPGGIAAAIAAARAGAEAIIIEPTQHVGGMMTSGLTATDSCHNGYIGGIAREFFQRNGAYYNSRFMWRLESHKAEKLFKAMLAEAGVPVVLNQHLSQSVLSDKRIAWIKTSAGRKFGGKVFIDAGYEGDLLAAAGGSFRVGREGAKEYQEPLAGVQPLVKKRQPFGGVSGLDQNGNPLPWVQRGPAAPLGSADHKIMAYNYRPCLTRQAGNQVPFTRPPRYRRSDYELLRRHLVRNRQMKFSRKFQLLKTVNRKYDPNSTTAFTTDMIGANWDYPLASRSERERIRRRHEDYTRGLYYFLSHDEGVPHRFRSEVARLGYCKDEFADNNHWPYQLYIREARRMIGEYVLSQGDMRRQAEKPDPVGMASCPIESHHVQMLLNEKNNVILEGWAQHSVWPYQIPYRSIVPKRNEVTNLLVPVAVSATHIAYSSLRMEPVYMILGHSAGVAAAIAAARDLAVQDVPYEDLSRKLRDQKQILHWRQRRGRREVDLAGGGESPMLPAVEGAAPHAAMTPVIGP
jgi:hypothetical protein